MKKQVLLLALGLVLNAAPVALATTSIEKQYVDNYRGRSGTPLPVSVVHPRVSLDYIGTEFRLEFTVDERGRPGRIVTRSAIPEELLEDVAAAVSRWKFIPLRGKNGEPIATEVILPMEIVASMVR